MSYGVLFDIRLRHDFWLNVDAVLHDALSAATRERILRDAPASRFMTLAPTDETRARMAGHGMLFKARPDGAVVGIELQPNTTVPRRPLGAGETLTFALTVTDRAFGDYTAEVLPAFAVFSNASGNFRGGERHLSQPVAAFDAARAYRAGDVRAVMQGVVTQLFQARRDTGPAANPVAADWQRVPSDTHDPAAGYRAGDVVLSADRLFRAVQGAPGTNLGNVADWTDLGPIANQYVTSRDRMALRSPLFQVDVLALGATALQARITRTTTGAEARRSDFADPLGLTACHIDLRGLADGRYRLDLHDQAGAVVAGQGLDFYLSAEASAKGWFGVIEVTPGQGPLALLSNLGALLSPRYDLRFLNILARRRYRFPESQPVGTGAEVAPDGADARALVTAAARPVSRHGGGLVLRANDPNTAGIDETVLLPHTTAPRLSRENGEWFSTTSHSNFPPLT
jgi:hypothetical protein